MCNKIHECSHLPLKVQSVQEDKRGPGVVLERGRGREWQSCVQGMGGQDVEREDG